MIHAIALPLLVAALAGAGLFNAIGLGATRDGFVRWGFPSWWCYVTGGLEILAALLVALAPSRSAGLCLAAAILAAALLAVLRRREFNHLPPIGLLVALIGLTAFAA